MEVMASNHPEEIHLADTDNILTAVEDLAEQIRSLRPKLNGRETRAEYFKNMHRKAGA
jgi:hypothetical protein